MVKVPWSVSKGLELSTWVVIIKSPLYKTQSLSFRRLYKPPRSTCPVFIFKFQAPNHQACPSKPHFLLFDFSKPLASEHNIKVPDGS